MLQEPGDEEAESQTHWVPSWVLTFPGCGRGGGGEWRNHTTNQMCAFNSDSHTRQRRRYRQPMGMRMEQRVPRGTHRTTMMLTELPSDCSSTRSLSHTPALDASSPPCPKATAPKAALAASTEQSFQSAHCPVMKVMGVFRPRSRVTLK